MKITLSGLACGITINVIFAVTLVSGKNPTAASMEFAMFAFKTIMVLVTIGSVLFTLKKAEDK